MPVFAILNDNDGAIYDSCTLLTSNLVCRIYDANPRNQTRFGSVSNMIAAVRASLDGEWGIQYGWACEMSVTGDVQLWHDESGDPYDQWTAMQQNVPSYWDTSRAFVFLIINRDLLDVNGLGQYMNLQVDTNRVVDWAVAKDAYGDTFTNRGFDIGVPTNFETGWISLTGNLAFGNVPTGWVQTATLEIGSCGKAFTVTNITYPVGFSGSWTGVVNLGYVEVPVTFSPTALTSYGGTIRVLSDAGAGSNSITCSGTGFAGPPVSRIAFNETFSDSDFTNSPNGTLFNATVDPGVAEVVNGELHILRSNSGGAGGAISVHYPVSIPLRDTTTVAFDVKAISSDVYGAGDMEAYPANVELIVQDATNGTRMLRFAYGTGGGLSETNAAMIQIARGDAPTNAKPKV